MDEDALLEAQVAALLRNTRKKKKKKKKNAKTTHVRNPPSHSMEGPYTYKFLLQRALALCEHDNPTSALYQSNSSTRLKLPPLNMCKYRTTRTCWSNFAQMCTILNRPADHVLKFIERDLAVTASINGKSQLILPIRIEARGMAHILDHYVKKYVLCMRCQSHRTKMHKDKVRRIHFVTCAVCLAESAAPPMKPGVGPHIAVKRGDRRRARQTTVQ